jgi:3-hydroxyisobutyrate dehydrogenase-like beta-hydroxyacid dehydrogenase
MTAVGWLGAGRMGSAMVRRLLAAGTEVVVWNRTPARVAPLVEDGARQAASIGEACRDVVFTSLAASADLEDVARQVATLPAAPRFLVDTSTVAVDSSDRVRELLGARGIGFLSSPVSGNPSAVASGQASFVCSGDAEAFTAARPVLETIGVGATYLGAGSEATIVKLGHNLLLAVVTQALAEVVTLCSQRGVEPGALMTFLNSSVVGSAFTSYKTPAIVAGDLTPTFTTELLLKDVELGLAEGRATHTPLALAGLVREALIAAMAQGHSGDDFLSLLAVQARAAGIAPTTEHTDDNS